MLNAEHIATATDWNESFDNILAYQKYLLLDIEKYKKQNDFQPKILAIKERTCSVINAFVNNTVTLIETQNKMLQESNQQQQQQQQQQYIPRTYNTRICDMPPSENERHFELLERFNQLEEIILNQKND